MGKASRHFCLMLPIICFLWLIPVPAFTQPPLLDAAEESPPPQSYYRRMMTTAAKQRLTEDRLLWGGLVSRLPAESLSFRLDYLTRRYDSRYAGDNRVGDVITPMNINDPFGSDHPFFLMETEVDGRLQILMMQLAYGITNNLSLYADFPIVRQEADLKFKFTPGTSTRVGVRTTDDAFRLFEKFGRPKPIARYRSPSWDPGDLEIGVRWTYLDHPLVLMASQGSLLIPTGRLADPSQAQRFGLGAQVDAGDGAFAPGFLQVLQVRMPEPYAWISLWLEGDFRYYMEQLRDAPGWRESNEAFDAFPDSLGLDDDRFLDLSKADDTYSVTYGARIDSVAGLIFSFPYFEIGLGHLYHFEQNPMISGDGQLKRFFDESRTYLPADTHSLSLQVGVPLEQLWTPVLFNVGYTYPLGGRNSIRLEDRVDLQAIVMFPLF